MTSSIYFGIVFTLSIVLLTINCAPTNSDAVDLQMNTDEAGNLQEKISSIHKREYPMEGILLGKRDYPMEGILLGRRDYPMEGILLGKRDYPMEGILLGKRNFRFFAPKASGSAKTY